MFPRTHRWRVVNPRGTWYRHKQQLAAGSLTNKRNYVRLLYCQEWCARFLFIDNLQNVHTQKWTKDLSLRFVNKRNHVRTVLPGMVCAASIHWLFGERSYIGDTIDTRLRLILFHREKCMSTQYFEEYLYLLLWFARNVHSTYYIFSYPCFS